MNEKDFRDLHKRQGWRDIGYHYLVFEDGRVAQTLPISQAGRHCKGYNSHSIGVAYVGGLDAQGHAADTRTDAQRAALLQLVVKLITMYRCDVWGHRDLSPDKNGDGVISPNEYLKECPCFNAHDEYHKYYSHIMQVP